MLKNLIVHNFVTGCTVLINRPLIDIHPDIIRFLNAARQGGTRAVAAALTGGIKKAGLLRSILFYLLLLKGSYKDEMRSN